MLVLFTDFGLAGPYVGQMKAVLHRDAPGVPVVDLFADAPRFDPMASAYLLAAYAAGFSAGTVFLCVVDPGVGGDRAPMALEADGRWFVGPDNGLLVIAARRQPASTWFHVAWRPDRLSASFHGRDLFAPVAARLATGRTGCLEPWRGARTGAEWPDDIPRVVYVDSYGNAMTGLRAALLPADARLAVAGTSLPRARTFSDVVEGEAFWYENANGLAEIAVNCGSAAERFGLRIGTPVGW